MLTHFTGEKLMLSKMKFFTRCHTAVEQCSWDQIRDLSDFRTYPVISEYGPQFTGSESSRVLSWILSLDLPENLHFNRFLYVNYYSIGYLEMTFRALEKSRLDLLGMTFEH